MKAQGANKKLNAPLQECFKSGVKIELVYWHKVPKKDLMRYYRSVLKWC
jgi:hypothetical protein